MYNRLFSNVPFKRRRGKPRESGLTVIIDRGLGVKAKGGLFEISDR